MIVVDTSVWADHFRASENHLVLLWSQGLVLQHPLVTGELAMGNLHDWRRTVANLQSLPQAPRLSDADVIAFVDVQELMGTGIGFVDAHILASVAGVAGASLWTRDKRLFRHAEHLGFAHCGD